MSARVVLAVALVGCTPDPTPGPAPNAAATASSAAAKSTEPDAGSTALDVDKALAGTAVDDQHFARRVFYTWTTPTQIEELQKNETLLSRMESKTYGRSMFDVELDAVLARDKNEPIAKALRGGARGLAQRRFAWSAPWPTVVPLGTQAYGDQLLEVELREQALVARFELGATPRWRFVDLQGREVPLEEAKTQLHRLGAVLHVAGPASAEADAGTRNYREYVLCNESMIARYRYGGPDLQHRLEDDAALLAALAAQPTLGAEREALFTRALAFPDVAAFAPQPPRLLELAQLLKRAAAAQTRPALARTRDVRFDAAPVALPKPRIPRGPT